MEETIRTSGTPFWSASTTARRGDVRRSRNKTIRPRPVTRCRTLRQRPLNRKTRDDRLSDRPILPTISLPTAHHPEHTIERGNHDSQTSPEKDDSRVDDEPFHNEAHRAAAGMTTTRNPPFRAHATRVVERARKRNTITKPHFQFNLSCQAVWYVVCHSVLYDVNTPLLQHTPNLLNILHIQAGNADAALDLAVAVLHDFKLKRDTVQTKNDFPAQ